MSEKVHFEASPRAAEVICKAVARAVVQDYPESGDEFSKQNAAAKRLVDEFDAAFDLVIDSIVKQVTDVIVEKAE